MVVLESFQEVYDKDESVVSRTIDDETILVPIRHDVGDLESIFTLNEVGARIWDLIDGVRPVGAIAKVLALEFKVDSEEAEKDAFEFCRQLEGVGAIRMIGAEK